MPMTEIIIRPKRPFPVFAGSIPSQRGGRRVNVLASIDQDGKWHIEKEDLGVEVADEPVLFVPFGGIDYALTKDDVKEMLAGMRERHQRWRENQPDPPDFTKALKDYYAALLHWQKGRQQFYIKEGAPKGG